MSLFDNMGRQFANRVANEKRKAMVEIRRWKGKPQFLPVGEMLRDQRWHLGRNRFRRANP